MTPARVRPVSVVFGPGRLGRALVVALERSGYPVLGIVPRKRPVRSGSRKWRAVSMEVAAQRASLLLLAVPDQAIEVVAGELAAIPVDWSQRVVLHHAGALGPAPLAALKRRGAATGVLHPLQCFGDSRAAASMFAGSRTRIEGDPTAIRVSRRLARDLGMRPLPLPPRMTAAQRQAYHAAASMASNDVVAIVGAATALFERCGLDRRTALEALMPLVGGTLAQIGSEGLGAAITGPGVRGDLETIGHHLSRLRRFDPDAAEAHLHLTLSLVRLARSEGIPIPRGLTQAIRALDRAR